MVAQLKHGVQGANGGRRAGAGRPPDAIGVLCRKIIDRKKLIHILGNIAEGKDLDQVINDNGEVLKIPASIKNRIEAIKELLRHGHPTEKPMLELQVDFIQQMNARLEEAIARAVPPKCPHCNNLLTMRQDIGRELTRLSQALTNA